MKTIEMQRLVTTSLLIIWQWDKHTGEYRGKANGRTVPCHSSFLKWHIWIHSSAAGNDTHTVMVLVQTVQTRKFVMNSKEFFPNLQTPAFRKVP